MSRSASTLKQFAGVPTEATPSITTATSFTLLAANSDRKYLLIQNNSSANVMISLSGKTLTDIAESATNIGEVLIPGASYENPPHYISTSLITIYQTSGATINTVVVIEG